eukprot:7377528-Prymnesium_polylepis.1
MGMCFCPYAAYAFARTLAWPVGLLHKAATPLAAHHIAVHARVVPPIRSRAIPVIAALTRTRSTPAAPAPAPASPVPRCLPL